MKDHQAHTTQGRLGLREIALSSSTNRECFRRNLVTLTVNHGCLASPGVSYTQDGSRTDLEPLWGYYNGAIWYSPGWLTLDK